MLLPYFAAISQETRPAPHNIGSIQEHSADNVK